jgi:hypothetical protein
MWFSKFQIFKQAMQMKEENGHGEAEIIEVDIGRVYRWVP